MAGGQQVERVLGLVHAAVCKVERDTGDEGDDGDSSVVPDDVGVVGQGSEGLGEGSGEGRGEELDGLDQGPHVLGRLGEGVLESGHGSEDLGDGDEDVDTSDSPDVDGRPVVWVASLIVSG